MHAGYMVGFFSRRLSYIVERYREPVVADCMVMKFLLFAEEEVVKEVDMNEKKNQKQWISKIDPRQASSYRIIRPSHI